MVVLFDWGYFLLSVVADNKMWEVREVGGDKRRDIYTGCLYAAPRFVAGGPFTRIW